LKFSTNNCDDYNGKEIEADAKGSVAVAFDVFKGEVL
jgi:hypothetical protein